MKKKKEKQQKHCNYTAEIGVKLVFEGDARVANANGTRSSPGMGPDQTPLLWPGSCSHYCCCCCNWMLLLLLVLLLLLLLHKANSILYHIARRYRCWCCCCCRCRFQVQLQIPTNPSRCRRRRCRLWQLFTSHFRELLAVAQCALHEWNSMTQSQSQCAA